MEAELADVLMQLLQTGRPQDRAKPGFGQIALKTVEVIEID